MSIEVVCGNCYKEKVSSLKEKVSGFRKELRDLDQRVENLFQKNGQNLEDFNSYYHCGDTRGKPAFTLREKVMVFSEIAATCVPFKEGLESLFEEDMSGWPAILPVSILGVKAIAWPFFVLAKVDHSKFEATAFASLIVIPLAVAFSALSLGVACVELVFKTIMFSLYKTLSLFRESEKTKLFIEEAKKMKDEIHETKKQLYFKIDSLIREVVENVLNDNNLFDGSRKFLCEDLKMCFNKNSINEIEKFQEIKNKKGSKTPGFDRQDMKDIQNRLFFQVKSTI